MDLEPQLDKYYTDRFEMFAHPAWKDLMDDVQTMLDATNRLDGVTPDTLKFKQGEVSMMRWMLSLKKTTEESYEELTNANHA